MKIVNVRIESTILGDVPRADRDTLRSLTVETREVQARHAGKITLQSGMKEYLERGPINTPTFIARHENSSAARYTIVGWAILLSNSGPVPIFSGPQVVSVFVHPEWRRNGIGSALVRSAHTTAQSNLRLSIVAPGFDATAKSHAYAFADSIPECLQTRTGVGIRSEDDFEELLPHAQPVEWP